MNPVLNRLQAIGSRVTHDELRYQLARKDKLNLSDDELENQIRVLELVGDVEVVPTYQAVEK